MTEVQAQTVGFWSIADRWPERTAIVGADGTSITFGQLRDDAEHAAAGLRALGLERGDGLAVVLPNVASFFTAYLAAMSAGLYLTPVNSHLAPPEIAHVLTDCEAGAVIVHEDLVEVCAAGVDGARFAERSRFADRSADGYRAVSELIDQGRSTPPLESRGTGAVMMYTSGTTGKPKGVRRPLPEGSPDEVLGEVSSIYCRGFGMPFDAVHLVCGPLYHAGPFSAATSALHTGNTVVLMDKWSPEECLRLVEEHRVTSTQMVPTMFHRLLALDENVRSRADVSSVASVMHTGAPCPTHVKQRFMDWFGPVVYETYGGTESVATIATPRRWLQKPGTVGKPVHGVAIHIVGENGVDLPVGEVGAIYIEHHNGTRSEYFKDPDKTASMRLGDWVTLGDVGYLDDDGCLFLRDRDVDLIISGGVNVYPAEVESVLLASDLVLDTAVIGVPDDEWGEKVLALVELVAGVDDRDQARRQLLDFCDGRLARFKRPRQIEFVDDLPRLPSGKVQKRLLREPYWAAAERSI